MSVMPEAVLQHALADGFRKVRQDPRILDTLFKQLNQEQLAEVKAFLDKKIDFSVNFPRKTTLKVPALVLLLRSETEAEAFMGNVMGQSGGFEVPDTDLSYDLAGAGQQGASVSGSEGLPRLVCGPFSVFDVEGDSRLLVIDDDEDELTEFILTFETAPTLGSYNLHVISGPGVGQVKPICRLGSDFIDIDGIFDVQLTSESVVVIRHADNPGASIGEPSRVYLSSDPSLIRKGVNYDAQYQLSVLAGHQDEVLYLGALVKSILLSQTPFLEGQGIMALKISASDFTPKNEYLPSEVFQRAMTLRFTYPFSFIETLDTFRSIDMNITPEAAGETPPAKDAADACTVISRIEL
jgi:hypothetical protein